MVYLQIKWIKQNIKATLWRQQSTRLGTVLFYSETFNIIYIFFGQKGWKVGHLTRNVSFISRLLSSSTCWYKMGNFAELRITTLNFPSSIIFIILSHIVQWSHPLNFSPNYSTQTSCYKTQWKRSGKSFDKNIQKFLCWSERNNNTWLSSFLSW